MSNGEICRWAWDKSREYRGVIWAAALLTFLVELPQITLGLLELLKGWNLPFGWEIPFQWVGTMAGFGLTGVILGLALEQETSPGKVFLPFSRDYFKRAALLALFLTVVTALIRIVPNRIISQGQEGMKAALTQIEMTEDEGAWNSLFGEYMKASDRVSKGEMLNNIISIVLEVVFFPTSLSALFVPGGKNHKAAAGEYVEPLLQPFLDFGNSGQNHRAFYFGGAVCRIFP